MRQVYAEKLDRLLHDAWAAWCARVGPALEVVQDSPAIREKILLRPASRTQWENPLEEAYYGAGEGRAVVEHPEVFLYHLADISITGSEVMLFGGAHTLLRLDSSQDEVEARKVRRPIAWRARRLQGPVLPLGGRGTGNRGHFLCEHLPRLLLARERLGGEVPLHVLLTPGHAAWQREYLARLGENPQLAVEGSRGTVHCEDAWFVPNLTPGRIVQLYEPATYREIARRFKSGLAPRRGGRSLFVTRKDAPSRRLANEDEVFAAFREDFPGLERISLSRMSLQDQVGLFASARVVVGAHSQAFRNLLYAEGALAIQLVPGPRDAANQYLAWATNYDRLGVIHRNRCLSLYSGLPYEDGDWTFPLEPLKRALARLGTLGPSVLP